MNKSTNTIRPPMTMMMRDDIYTHLTTKIYFANINIYMYIILYISRLDTKCAYTFFKCEFCVSRSPQFTTGYHILVYIYDVMLCKCGHLSIIEAHSNRERMFYRKKQLTIHIRIVVFAVCTHQSPTYMSLILFYCNQLIWTQKKKRSHTYIRFIRTLTQHNIKWCLCGESLFIANICDSWIVKITRHEQHTDRQWPRFWPRVGQSISHSMHIMYMFYITLN